jgi:hypothetical protein
LPDPSNHRSKDEEERKSKPKEEIDNTKWDKVLSENKLKSKTPEVFKKLEIPKSNDYNKSKNLKNDQSSTSRQKSSSEKEADKESSSKSGKPNNRDNLKNYLSRSCSRTIDHNFAKRLEDPK